MGALGLLARVRADSTASIGGLAHLGLRGVGVEPAPLAPTIPHQLFMVYQMMFAIITPALITGAFAERMKFSAFVVFTLLWATLVYDPVAHWVWGGGFIGATWGALDFAGGTVVHISSGMSALVVRARDRQAARLRLRPDAAAQPAAHA